MALQRSKSMAVINQLQRSYGSADYQNWQSLRRQFWSFVKYPIAGISRMTFFGESVGSLGNRQLTNMPKQGSFGQNQFQLKCIRCGYFIADQEINSFDGTDASTLYSELVNGVFQAGELELVIGSRLMLQIPKPLLYMPPADGRSHVKSAGLEALTTFQDGLATARTAIPHAELLTRKESAYLVDPNILIEAEQNFECTISYPSGMLPLIATDVVDDDTNPLYLGIVFDGIVFRPMQ